MLQVAPQRGTMTLIQEAVTNRPFPQIHLLSEQLFASFLRQRGLDVGPKGIRAFVEIGLIEELDDQYAKFHPFQIWPICRFLSAIETRLNVGISWHGLKPEGLKRFVDINWCRHAEYITEYPKSEEVIEFNQRILPLMLWIESYFLPVVRGRRTGLLKLVNTNVVEWDKWRSSISFDEWLCGHSISIERLSQWRERVLLRALDYDPNPDLYLLLRSMPFDKRDRFKDKLRLAYDLYELSELSRMALERIGDRSERKEWHPTGDPSTAWVERLYGTQPKFGAPEFLRPLVRRHGLDPAPRVRWLVEGETEESFILRYAKGFVANFEEYATIDNVGGDGALTGKKHIAAVNVFMEAAKNEQCFVALTFDESSGACKRVQELIHEGLVNLCYVVNKPDFELDNFKVDELVTVAAEVALETPYPISLDREYLSEEVAREVTQNKKDFKKALNDVLHRYGEMFKLSKGKEWGDRLGTFLSSKRDDEFKSGVYSEEALTKIEQQVLRVLRGSEPAIDYPLSIQEIDPSSLEIQGPQ